MLADNNSPLAAIIQSASLAISLALLSTDQNSDAFWRLATIICFADPLNRNRFISLDVTIPTIRSRIPH